MFYPARPLPQILKLIRYFTRNIFMEKICRKPAIKISSMCLFNLANSPKQPLHAWDFWKKLFLKEIMKKVTWFFPLHPVTFYGENFEKQKCLELVTSPLSCKTCLQKKKGKMSKDWINRGKKRFSKLFKMLFFW